MKSYIQPGETLTVTAPATVSSGDGVLVGDIFGIATCDAASGASVEIKTTGVFDMDKTSAQAWTVGALIYWDNSGKVATTAESGNKLIGVAAKAADNPSSTGYVRLNGAASVPVAGNLDTAAGVAAAGAANVCEVTITAKDAAGNTVAGVHHMDVWLSDDADGQGLTGTSASGTVQAKSASGTVLQIYSAKKAFRVQTLKTGVFVLEITDTAKTAFKVCANVAGRTVVLDTLASGDYGA